MAKSMISISELTENEKGLEVVYDNHGQREFGHISSWNDKYIFVRYGSNTQSQATNPEDLTWGTK
jgi:hypothetical protein